MCGCHPKTDTRWHEQTRPYRASSQVLDLPLTHLRTPHNKICWSSGGLAHTFKCLPPCWLPPPFSRLTIHMDEELRGLAFTTLQALMVDFPEWREDVLSGFVYFIVREVTDVHPTLLDNAVKMLLQLISQWRQAVQSSNKSHDLQVRQSVSCIKVTEEKLGLTFMTCFCFFQQGPGSGHSLSLERNPLSGVLHVVEGLALVVLCSCRPATRRLAVNVLKEVRALHTALGISKVIISDSLCCLF